MVSFNFDEFGCAFASTMRELDEAFAADDINLEAILESCQVMDTIVFIFHNLAELNESDNAKEEVKLTNLALTMVFIVMGRVVERCLKTSPSDSCPLLPALLVSLDYLPFLLHKTEEKECRFDEKSEIAISYFFSKLVDFLNRLNHELRYLAPLAPMHLLLDFSSHMDLSESFDRGKELRLQRIINSAIEITSRQKKNSQKWLFFDKQGTRFNSTSGALQCKGDRSLGRRLFDIYIQGVLAQKDFNIADEAGGFGKAVVKTFPVTIKDGNLEIRLYWAGKGTMGTPVKGVYGPLISAIAVDPDLKSMDDKFATPNSLINTNLTICQLQ